MKEQQTTTPQPSAEEEPETPEIQPLPLEMSTMPETGQQDLSYPEEFADAETRLLPAYPEEMADKETQLLSAYPEETADKETQLLPTALAGLSIEKTPRSPISQAGLSVEEPPMPPLSAFRKPVEQTPLPPTSLPGLFAEETPLPAGYAPEVVQKKTELFPSYQRWKRLFKQKRSLLLACLSGLLVIVLVMVSILAQHGGQRSLLTKVTPSVTVSGQSPTPGRPTPVPTPQAQPVQPFPTILKAQIATLEAHDRFFYNGNVTLPEIALTFDDGPSPAYTPQILAILKHYHVKATFFDLGRLVKAYPELARQELKDGHIVGNHTWTHPDLPLLSASAIKTQIRQTSDAIEQVIGVRPIFMRPPYGDISARVLTVINSFGMTTVIWNDEAKDWSLPGTSVIVARILNLAYNGAIILLHDGGGVRLQTVQALPTIIEQLRARGYKFVTMDEIVAHAHKGQHKGKPTPTPSPSGTSTSLPESILSSPGELSPWWDEYGWVRRIKGL